MLPHIGVGITNDGVETLNLFKELYDKVIIGWHGFKHTHSHKYNMDPKGVKPITIPQADFDKYVTFTRVRAGRSI